MTDQDIFSQLEEAISKDDSKLKDWSVKYFHTHKKRYQFDLSVLKSHYSSGRVLEIGSAPYHVTYLIKESGYPVIGVDIDPERQSKFVRDNDLEIVKCNIEQEPLPFGDNEFNYIILNEVFEHLRINPIKTLKEINRVLHPSGYLVLTTPNLYSFRNIISLIRGKGFDDPYQQFLKLETLGHMGHVREYTVGQVREFLKNTGYRSVKVYHKSHKPMQGLWRPFNILRRIFPVLNSFQVHICSKAN